LDSFYTSTGVVSSLPGCADNVWSTERNVDLLVVVVESSVHSTKFMHLKQRALWPFNVIQRRPVFPRLLAGRRESRNSQAGDGEKDGNEGEEKKRTGRKWKWGMEE